MNTNTELYTRHFSKRECRYKMPWVWDIGSKGGLEMYLKPRRWRNRIQFKKFERVKMFKVEYKL